MYQLGYNNEANKSKLSNKRCRINLRSSLIIIIGSLLLNIGSLYAQIKPNVYLDKRGILRWTADQSEVNEFGVNYTLPFAYAYWACEQLNLSKEKAIDEDVYHIARLGLTAYRIHVWDTEISDTIGNLLDNEHLHLLDYTLKKMKDRGFKIILTPIAFWNGVPEKGKKLPGFSFKYGKNNSYSNPDAIKAAEKYLYQFMNHINCYTNIAYKDDPDIIAFEISNEPEHPTETPEQTTLYVNTLVKAIRSSGCQKPLFYCMSIAPRLLDAFLEANIQGGSVQWYPFSHNGGFNWQGNLLTHIDKWPKDSITGKIKARNKALIAYEIDAADNGYTFSYPFMARAMRQEGFQFVTMFSYDPLCIAYSNSEYRTHFMNLAYAPQKALSLKIAGEAFHRIPMEKNYGVYPADTLFDAFRVSYAENLAEMLTDEKFMYTNTTWSLLPSAAKLKEIAGYGSSAVVQYSGRGAYFLDKLENGIWRLEVMPDATWVTDPFSNPTLDKEASAIVWNTWPMNIDLPDLGSGFSLVGINMGNTIKQTANEKQVNVSPGTYLLVKEGIKSKWKPEDKWKNITLNEFVAPQATTNCYILHRPTEEITKGSPYNIKVEVISAKKPESIQLFINTSGPRRLPPVAFEEISYYNYAASIPDTLLSNEGILKYQIVVGYNGKFKTYPADIEGTPMSRDFNNNQMYTTRIVSNTAPICLLDISTDNEKMRKPHRRFSFIYRPSLLPGKTGLVMDQGNISYTSFFCRDKITGRKADLTTKQKLILRGSALSEIPLKMWVSLQLKNGFEYGDTVLLNNSQLQYELPLNKFRRIFITGPGEKGPVSIKSYPEINDGMRNFNIEEAETIKITVIPAVNASKIPQAAVEYILLE